MREFVRLKRLLAFRKIEVPSIHPSIHPPFARYGKADVDGRTRNIFDALANLNPSINARPSSTHTSNSRGIRLKKKKKSRATILISDNWKSFPSLEKSVGFFPPPKKRHNLRCEKRVSDPDERCFALDFLLDFPLPSLSSFLSRSPVSFLAANPLDFPCVFATHLHQPPVSGQALIYAMLRDLFALEPAYRSQLFLSLHLLGQSRLVRRLSNTPLLFLLFPDLLDVQQTSFSPSTLNSSRNFPRILFFYGWEWGGSVSESWRGFRWSVGN